MQSAHRPALVRAARHLGVAAALLVTSAALTGTFTAAGASPARPTRQLAGGSSTTTLAYGSYRFAVPSSWPVIDLAADPTQCVRFDVHAVYLGHPGDSQQCPSRLTGVTEALLVEPDDATSRARLESGAVSLPAGTTAPAGLFASSGGRAQVVVPDAGVIVTAAYRDDPSAVRAVLDSGRVAGATPSGAPATPVAPPAAVTAPAPAAALAVPHATAPTALGTGRGVGFAFDTCGTPSLSDMTAWLKSPYRTAGVYLGGRNYGCPASAITASWVSSAAAMGWGIVPIYVGYQAPVDNCGCASMSSTKATASSQGTSEGADAVKLAKAAGLAPGNTLYFDMEGYSRTATNTGSVMAYLSAWTKALHTAGYHSGVYSSSSSGMADLVAYSGTSGFYAPDNLWMADWNSNLSTFGDPFVPDSIYRGNRMHQFSGAHSETWGGVTIDIDSNAMNAGQDCLAAVCTTAIQQLYAAMGGAKSAVGTPVGAEAGTSVGQGRTQGYTLGAIVEGWSTGVHEVHGAIYSHYRELGGTKSPLGFPTHDTSTAADGVSRMSTFAGGLIVMSSASGVHEVHGNILDAWKTAGATKGALRDPTSDEMDIPGGLGRMNTFQLGAIYWSSALGAHEVHGSLFSRYKSMGGPTGSLGLPTSNTFTSGALRRSNFQHGYITYNPVGGATQVVVK
jgi:hypothetical protein